MSKLGYFIIYFHFFPYRGSLIASFSIAIFNENIFQSNLDLIKVFLLIAKATDLENPTSVTITRRQNGTNLLSGFEEQMKMHFFAWARTLKHGKGLSCYLGY